MDLKENTVSRIAREMLIDLGFPKDVTPTVGLALQYMRESEGYIISVFYTDSPYHITYPSTHYEAIVVEQYSDETVLTNIDAATYDECVSEAIIETCTFIKNIKD